MKDEPVSRTHELGRPCRLGQFPRLRLLCVSRVEPSWVNLALQLDAQGCIAPVFKWESEPAAVLDLVREESFDCVVIATDVFENTQSDRCEPWLNLARALRASGCDDALVIVAAGPSDRLALATCEVDAELLVAPHVWQSRAVALTIERAIAQAHMRRELQNLTLAQHRRLVRERDEAEYLLTQQRQILSVLECLGRVDEEAGREPAQVEASPSGGVDRLPAQVHDYYQELLRTYVIMGSGNLGNEIAKLVEVLSEAGLSPRGALELHLQRVESLVLGLGNRSTRHVMARADLLALELVIHLGEAYQRRATLRRDEGEASTLMVDAVVAGQRRNA